jgi:hypothetical protein
MQFWRSQVLGYLVTQAGLPALMLREVSQKNWVPNLLFSFAWSFFICMDFPSVWGFHLYEVFICMGFSLHRVFIRMGFSVRHRIMEWWKDDRFLQRPKASIYCLYYLDRKVPTWQEATTSGSYHASVPVRPWRQVLVTPSHISPLPQKKVVRRPRYLCSVDAWRCAVEEVIVNLLPPRRSSLVEISSLECFDDGMSFRG